MPGIDYTLGMKTSGFDTGVSGALGKLAGLGKAAAAATAAAGLGAAAGIGALIAKSIGKAADMETLETAFIPLLGGIDQAKARLEELSQFAAATPFDLPEVAEASKLLQGMTNGALATGKGLTMVGDAAAFAGRSYQDLARWIGQVYVGSQQGGTFGEGLDQLTQLAVIGPAAKQQIMSMKDAGAGFPEIWAVAEREISKFSGSMKLQSGTWTGLMSTLKDEIARTMAQFGAPIMDSLKPYLEGATAQITKFQASAIAAGEKIGSAIAILRAAFTDGKLGELVGQSLKLGFKEAVNTLAKGIQAAVVVLREGLRMSGLSGAVESLFVGIAKKFGAEILDALSNVRGFGGLADEATRLRREGGAELYFSRREFEDFDPAAGLAAGAAAWNDALKNAPGLFDVAAEREKLEAILAPLRAQNAADEIFRDLFKRQDVAAIVKPQPATDEAPAAVLAKATGGLPTGDRLAQIGGYVGGSAAGLARKAAEATAKWTEMTARGVQSLLQRGPGRTAAVF